MGGIRPGRTAPPITSPLGHPVNQVHAGAAGVNAGVLSCENCHTVREADGGSSMEVLGDRRGGVWADTPVVTVP